MHAASVVTRLVVAALALTDLMVDGSEAAGQRLLARLYDRLDSAALLCRLCERAVRIADATCPVGAADRARDRQ